MKKIIIIRRKRNWVNTHTHNFLFVCNVLSKKLRRIFENKNKNFIFHLHLTESSSSSTNFGSFYRKRLFLLLLRHLLLTLNNKHDRSQVDDGVIIQKKKTEIKRGRERGDFKKNTKNNKKKNLK